MSAGKTGGLIAVLAVVGSIGYIGAQGYVNNGVAKESVREIADKIEKQVGNGFQIEFEKADAPIFGDSISASGVTLLNGDDEVGFQIGSVKMSADGYVEGESFPTSATFDIDSVKIVDERIKASFAPYLEENYASKAMSATLGYEFNQDADSISGNISFSVPEMSEVSVALSLSEVAGIWDILESNYSENEGKIDLDRSQERELNRLAKRVRLQSLDGRYTNNGEIESIFAQASENNGISEDQAKAELLEIIDQHAGEMKFADELKAFVKEPKSLSVTFAPKEPMSFQEVSGLVMVSAMGKAEDALSGVNLEVKANQ